jgi:PKD repeat protein
MSNSVMKRAGPGLLCTALVILTLTGVLNLLPVHAPAINDFTVTNKYVWNGAVTTNLGIPDGGSSFKGQIQVSNVVSGTTNPITFSTSMVNSTASVVPTATFFPNPVTLMMGADSLNTTVSFGVNPAVPHGAYNLTLAASNGPTTHYISFVIKVYSIAITIDAQSTSTSDTTVESSFSTAKSVSVGVLVANATNAGGTLPKCTVAWPCALSVFGFQFGLSYNSSVVVPQGDPNPAATPGNSAGLYVDGAQTAVLFGGQGTIGEGSASFTTIAAAGNAFPVATFSPGEVLVGYTFKSPTPAAFLASTTGRFVLANVNFELLQKPATPTNIGIHSADVAFSTIYGSPSCECVNSTLAGQGGTAAETITNAPPTAKFTVTPLAVGDASCKTVYSLDATSGCSVYSFRFDASASTGSSALSYTWDFGDGSRDSAAEQTATCPPPDSDLTCSQGAIVVHDFAAVATLGGAPVPPAAYAVTLRVADASGATGSARDLSGNPISNVQPSHVTQTATANLAPQASFTFLPSSPGINLAVTFTSTSTDDSDGIGTYQWSFGDGSPQVINSAPTNTATHSYALGGTYTVTLRVNDTLGATNTTTRTVTVIDLPPTVSLTPSSNPTEGQVFTLTITEADPDGTIASNSINWGDGTTPTSITGSTSSQAHTYATAATYTINVTVTDNGGKATSKTLALTVAVHQPPTLIITPSTGPTAGQTFTLTLAATASYGSVSNVTINWGDGTTQTYTGNPTSETHTYANSGSYTITVTATDTGGKTVQQTSAITVQAPSSLLLYIIIAVVAIAAILGVLLLMRKRRTAQQPTTPITTPPKK